MSEYTMLEMEMNLNEIMNDEATQDLMKSDSVTSDDLIQIIMSAKDRIKKT